MNNIDKSHPKYNKLIEVGEKSYVIKVEELEENEEIICPLDSSMKVCKLNGKVIVKKKARFHPF